MSSWTSWFGSRRDAPAAASAQTLVPDQHRWTAIMNHPQITPHFNNAFRKDKATYAAMSCEADLVDLAECEFKNPHDDSKCEPYRLRSLLCMESVVNPARAEQFTTCLRTAGSPAAVQAKCMPIFEEVLKDLEKASETGPLPLTPDEQDIVKECGQEEEARSEEALSCFLPRVCTASYSTFSSCMEQNGADINKCVSEGQQLMECWGDFCVRMFRNQNTERN